MSIRRYVFVCPICRKFFTTDEPGEPLCTGPSETRDEHELQVMRLHAIERKQVPPQYAERRAVGTLLMPFDEKNR